MVGDYYRYGTEVSEGDTRTMSKEKARSAYEKAQQVANMLAPTNPIKLGLALNFSVFYYEICAEPILASDLARVSKQRVRVSKRWSGYPNVHGSG